MPDRPVVVFEDVHIEGEVAAYLTPLFERVTVLAPGLPTPPDHPLRAQAFAWVGRRAPLDATALAALPALRFASAWGVGYDHIDTEAATARRIPVSINPVFTRSVAEAALTLMLALSKRLTYLLRDAHTGRRTLETERGVELAGKTLGVVGFGRIGEDIGRLAAALDMRVLAYDPHRPATTMPGWARLIPLDALLAEADVVVTVAALTPATRHMIGAPELAQMKPSAFLVNVGRGALVDEAALHDALAGGRLAGAGIDVWEEEPLTPDHPLLALPNVIGTPHKLASTWDSVRHICAAVQANLDRVLRGEPPLNVVNPGALDAP